MTAKPTTAFAAKLKALREQSGMTQQQLAVKAGLSVSNLAQIEQGQKADPRLSTVMALALALSIKPGEFLDGLAEPFTAPDAEPAGEKTRGRAGKKK